MGGFFGKFLNFFLIFGIICVPAAPGSVPWGVLAETSRIFRDLGPALLRGIDNFRCHFRVPLPASGLIIFIYFQCLTSGFALESFSGFTSCFQFLEMAFPVFHFRFCFGVIFGFYFLFPVYFNVTSGFSLPALVWNLFVPLPGFTSCFWFGIFNVSLPFLLWGNFRVSLPVSGLLLWHFRRSTSCFHLKCRLCHFRVSLPASGLLLWHFRIFSSCFSVE